MAEDLFQRGSRMIERVRNASLAHTVRYVREQDGSVLLIPATVDTIDTDLLTEDQIGIADRMRDFLFSKSDLMVEGDPFKPTPGDVVRETIDDIEVAYEVANLESDPCWAYDDQLNLRIRVHTRRVT